MAHTEIELRARKLRLSKIDPDIRLELSRKKYERRLEQLQLRMLEIQRAYHHLGRRAVILFEGWDAAGKGGAIRRLTGKLDPRGYHVHAIGAPTSQEQGTHYLYRFWQRMPAPGRIAIFDRSWYGRVLVERVEGFAERSVWKRAYRELNELEQLLVADGVVVVKFFLHISKQEQLQRFRDRLRDPHKRWKITPEDLRNRERWTQYTKATHDMFDRTDTEAAPWAVVSANHKWHARVAVLEAAIAALSDGQRLKMPQTDPDFVDHACEVLGMTLD